MSTKSKIAALAALVTVIAAPAFAGDHDLATELRDSGRYVPQVQAARIEMKIPVGAYAARKSAPAFKAKSQATDFQLEGRN